MVFWESLSDKGSSKRKETRGQSRIRQEGGGNGVREGVAVCVSGSQGRGERIRDEG